MARFLFFPSLLAASALHVGAQQSPEVQQKISAAIAAAANTKKVDYTAFVNPFIGTDRSGNVWCVSEASCV